MEETAMGFIPRALLALARGALAALAASPASAQSWPQTAVRLILPLGPGSATDVTARLYAERLALRWGQPVVVENRPGPDGLMAGPALLAARAPHPPPFSLAGAGPPQHPPPPQTPPPPPPPP